MAVLPATARWDAHAASDTKNVPEFPAAVAIRLKALGLKALGLKALGPGLTLRRKSARTDHPPASAWRSSTDRPDTAPALPAPSDWARPRRARDRRRRPPRSRRDRPSSRAACSA